MGMFDEVSYKGSTYQTKDLCNCLLNYKIDKDDYLYIPVYKHVKKDGKVLVVLSSIDKTYYHGFIHIYNEKDSIFLKFNDGKLVKVVNKEQYNQSKGCKCFT